MFKRGDRVILEKSVNAIPAGCYRFLSHEDGQFWFGVGSKMEFTISENGSPLLKKVFAPAAFTHPNEFVPKYYALLNAIRGTPFTANVPFTSCYLDASIPVVQRFEASYPFETRQ